MVVHGTKPPVRELRRIGRHSVSATMSIDDTAEELGAKISAQAPQELVALLRAAAPPLLPTEMVGASHKAVGSTSSHAAGSSWKDLLTELQEKEREVREAAGGEVARLRQLQLLMSEAMQHLQQQLAKAAAGFEKAAMVLSGEAGHAVSGQPPRRPWRRESLLQEFHGLHQPSKYVVESEAGILYRKQRPASSGPDSSMTRRGPLDRTSSVPILRTQSVPGGARSPLSAAVPRGVELVSLAQREQDQSTSNDQLATFRAVMPSHAQHANSQVRPATSPAGGSVKGIPGGLASSGGLRLGPAQTSKLDLERTAASLLADSVWRDPGLGITPTPPSHSVIVSKVMPTLI